ncbi:MAG: thiamine biosynthesis protein ThiS [Methylophilaceae bacterium 17-44-8]|jgi:sulfur carrier protein|nr:MAG: thiamine biosynthesis protein ThiS [Methylophilales bacterium 28-44-11]OYZ11904.1 MAG: thiamine biosynthesis protein ThiS [Methylophilales bacterium 16-45-7]OZA06051.1 MAG: thiamine biosynthesis protein ThiS [Methylophilaceae bacterium 17-44-8]
MQITINGNDKHFDTDAMSISALVLHMNLVGKRIAIEHNGEIVPRSQFEVVMLTSGDRLEIVGAVGGG